MLKKFAQSTTTVITRVYYIIAPLRYSVTLKNSDLKKAMTPFQRRRLLSIAAALSDPVEVHRDEDGKGSIEEGDVFVRKQLDSETGQTMVPEENGVFNLFE